MGARGPDLIQRAAARLAKVSHASSTVEMGGQRTENLIPKPSDDGPRAAVISSGVPDNGGAIVTVSPTSLAANGIVLPGSAPSRTVEEFRAIKRHIGTNNLRPQNPSVANGSAIGRVVLITSARPGEGKTFTAINLALALAYEKDTRVLLMDGDAYRQSLLAYLGISAQGGWLDVVSGAPARAREFTLQTNVPNLSILPAGAKRAEIPELMASRHMRDLLNTLVQEDLNRYVIIDSLPCLASTEPAILAALAAQTIFVVAAHQTSRDEIESSLRLLSASPSVNLILNRAKPVLTEQFAGYGYGYAGGYGP